jgi:LacI family transcriptional regulator
MRPSVPRLKDVAKEAGVSVTTASVVLRDRRDGVRISEETRRRVKRAARDLQYAPSALARGLRNQQTQTLGFVSNRVISTPFAVAMLDAAQAAAAEHDQLLFITEIGRNASQAEEQRAVDMLVAHHVAHLIYASVYHQVIDPPDRLPADTIFLNCEPRSGGYRAIVPDDYRGAVDVVTHLVALGHSRIAFLNHGAPLLAARARRRGYESALTAHGLPVDPELYAISPTSRSAGFAAGHLLDRPEATRPTAIFCFNDRMAVAAYREARGRGIRIPDDLSIAGYDDQIYVAAEQQPRLTTLALPHAEMGRLAVEMALSEAEPSGESQTLVPGDLVIRESSAPPGMPPARPQR